MPKPEKSEYTLREFAEKVGRNVNTIRRHLQADYYKGRPGPLHGKTTKRNGWHYFPSYLIQWYTDNVKSSAWDQKPSSSSSD